MPKKQSLFPLEYDEISLVDAGGGEAEDGSISPSVLIAKRNGSGITKLNPVGNSPTVPTKPKPKPKPSSSSGSSSSSSSSSSSGSKKKTSSKKKTDPCNPKSSTGKKTGKSSQRAKNWQEGRHPRQQGGKFGQSSAQSKKKYGKDGTTHAKQVAECKRRHSSGSSKVVAGEAKITRTGPSKRGPKYTAVNARAKNAKGRRFRPGSGAGVAKSSMTDARLRALVERKAAR